MTNPFNDQPHYEVDEETSSDDPRVLGSIARLEGGTDDPGIVGGASDEEWSRLRGSVQSLEGGWPYTEKELVGMDRSDFAAASKLWPNGYGEYTTKDSGKRAEFAGGGVRDTQEGKPRFDLLLPETVPYRSQMLTRFAELMGRGAEKYEDRNWEFFSDDRALARARSSAFRHFMQWFNGETDEDHAAAVFFNITAAEYIEGVLDGSWPDRSAIVQIKEAS